MKDTNGEGGSGWGTRTTAISGSTDFRGGCGLGGEADVPDHLPRLPEGRQRVYFEGRLQVADVDGDGKNELVLFENIPSPGYLFDDLRVYEKGKLSSLR